ncbi:MAG: UxaA family hydrolase, partial [candidate division NC10 bacterium]|nr:UxaA family hydrolase [candidate division NC10 bacterium]
MKNRRDDRSVPRKPRLVGGIKGHNPDKTHFLAGKPRLVGGELHLTFLGYRRPGGEVGTRNCLGIFSLVTCANEAALHIARQVPGSAVFTHQQGCGQTQADLE